MKTLALTSAYSLAIRARLIYENTKSSAVAGALKTIDMRLVGILFIWPSI
jgi:hypothetical protein